MLKHRIYILCLLIFFSCRAFSDFAKIGTVELIITSKQTAEVKLSTDFFVKLPVVLYVGSKEKNCEVSALKKVDKTLQIQLGDCKNEVKLGSDVFYHENSFDQQEPSVDKLPTVSKDEDQNKIESDVKPRTSFFSVGVGLRLANRLKYETAAATVSGNSYSGKLEYTGDSSVLFSLNFTNVNIDSWGANFGIERFQTDWSSFSDGSSSYAAAASTTVTNVYWSGVYRWSTVIVPIGINYGFLSSSGASFLEANKGGIGAQLGIGVISSKNIMLIAESKVIYFTGATVSSGSTILSTSEGYYSGINLVAYFSF